MPKQIIESPNVPKPVGPYSQAVKVGNFIFLSGQIPLDPKTGIKTAGGVETQTKRVMDNIKSVLEAAGANMSNIVKTTVFLRRIDDMKFMNDVYQKYFEKDFPVRSTVQVADLPKSSDVEIECVAYVE